MDYIRDRTKTACRGKWKEHGEIDLSGGGNHARTGFWIFKDCKRCHRNIFAQWFTNWEDYQKVWLKERKKELDL